MRCLRSVYLPMVSIAALLTASVASPTGAFAQEAGAGSSAAASPVKNWAAIDQWPDFSTGTWVSPGPGGGVPPPGTVAGGPGSHAAPPSFPLGFGLASTPPYKPEIAAKLSKAPIGASSCEPSGVVTDPGTTFYFGKDVIVIGGMSDWYNTWRRVYLNRTTHGDDPEPTYFGDSIGHWEGKTLVIDTTAIRGEAKLGTVKLNSYATHMVERYRLVGPNTLERVVTVTNPDLLTKPWVTKTLLKRDTTNPPFPESYCWKDREANADNPDFTPPN